MKFIFKGQTSLRITIRTGADLSTVTDSKIRFQKPSGSIGTFSAYIIDKRAGLISHDVTTCDELDESGWWKFYAYVTYSDGRCAPGRAVRIYVYPEGE